MDFQAAVNLPGHDASTWTALLVLRGPGSIDLTATGDGTEYRFAATSLATANWAPGTYWYSLRVANGTSKTEIQTGEMAIVADLAGAAIGYDGRSENEIALAAIKAVLGRRATLDQDRYRINNRELYRTTIADLLKLRTYYVAAVRRERHAKSGNREFGRQIKVRF